jgi:hypothetical protein
MIADPEGPSFITRTVGRRRYADDASVSHDPNETLNAATRERINYSTRTNPDGALHANCKDSENSRSGTVARSPSSVGGQFDVEPLEQAHEIWRQTLDHNGVPFLRALRLHTRIARCLCRSPSQGPPMTFSGTGPTELGGAAIESAILGPTDALGTSTSRLLRDRS